MKINLFTLESSNYTYLRVPALLGLKSKTSAWHKSLFKPEHLQRMEELEVKWNKWISQIKPSPHLSCSYREGWCSRIGQSYRGTDLGHLSHECGDASAAGEWDSRGSSTSLQFWPCILVVKAQWRHKIKVNQGKLQYCPQRGVWDSLVPAEGSTEWK